MERLLSKRIGSVAIATGSIPFSSLLALILPCSALFHSSPALSPLPLYLLQQMANNPNLFTSTQAAGYPACCRSTLYSCFVAVAIRTHIPLAAGPSRIGPLISFYWRRSVSMCELKADVASLEDSDFKTWSKAQKQSHILEMHSNYEFWEVNSYGGSPEIAAHGDWFYYHASNASKLR